MEILEKKIKDVQDYRDLYFVNNPTASYDQFLIELKKKVSDLRQEIPVVQKDVKSVAAANSFIQGKILNIMPDYDSNCENYLIKAVKKDCSKWEHWLELALCIWKKNDFEGALDCMKEAYKISNDLAVVNEYITVLRNQKKPELNKIAKRLCQENINKYPEDSFIWYSYANQCLHDFYNYDKNIENLYKSLESFEKCLQYSTSETILPSDFYLNFSSAHYSNGNILECCLNLTKAFILEPYYDTIKEKITSVNNLIEKIYEKRNEFLKDNENIDEFSKIVLTDILDNSNKISSYYGVMINDDKKVVICDIKNLLIIDILMKNSGQKDIYANDSIPSNISLSPSRLLEKQHNFIEKCQKQSDKIFTESYILSKMNMLFPNFQILYNFNIFCYY